MWFSVVGGAVAWDNAPEKPWDKLENCKLVESYANDGDSFHVMHGDKEYVFRLCFVDCAETSMTYKDRVQDQADWWGISTKDAVRAGNDATKFTLKLLEKDFTVYTKYKDARGNSKLGRNFAMIKVGDDFLSELLVKNGLARVYGYPVKTPDGISAKSFRSQLDSIEKTAKRERKGAWNYADIDFFKRSREIKSAQQPEGKNVDGDALILTSPVALYSDNHSVSFRGTLKAGTEIYILDESDKQMIKVRAPFRGNMVTGQCRKTDLARSAPNEL